MRDTTTKRTFKLCAAAISALLVAGCAVEQPNVNEMSAAVMPQGWSNAPLPFGDAAAFKHFWLRWNDPGLAAVVERATLANTDVLTAAANLRAAHASLISANASLWPSATLDANTNRNRAQHQTTTDYSASASGAWTLNLAGAQYWYADAAELSLRASALSLEDVKESVAAEAAQAYVNLRAAQAQLALVRATLENYRETADTARWQFEAGTGAASEAEDALVQLASARARIPQIELSITQYKNVLARLTALPTDQLPISAEGVIPVPPAGCAVSMPAALLERRPDIRSAQRSLEAAVESLRSAKSNYWPTLSIRGDIGTTAATVSALGASGTGIIGLVGALSVPVLNWGSLIAEEETAAARLDEARASYISVLLRALEEADNAIAGIASAERRNSDLVLAVEHARIAEQLSRTEYETGIGDYAMLLTTQRSLISMQETELANRADLANNYIMLYRALGGGWAVRQAENESSGQPEEDSQAASSTNVGLVSSGQ